MSAHTPGPWQAVPWSNGDGGFNIVTALHDKAGLHHLSSDFVASTGVCPNPWQGGKNEAEANARLIASAPEMADEIERLRALLWQIETDDDVRCPNARALARRARDEQSTRHEVYSDREGNIRRVGDGGADDTGR